MLVARSAPECYLYLDLHPCACGSTDFAVSHHLERADDGFVAVFHGPCLNCQELRRFEFEVHAEDAPPPPAYGGPRPSQIVDPGQFMLLSDDMADEVPGDPDTLDLAGRVAAAEYLLIAIAALEEVAKFLPESGESVPAELCVSPEGRAVHDREPRRFHRAQIDRALDVYRGLLLRYARAGAEPTAAADGEPAPDIGGEPTPGGTGKSV